MRGTEVIFWRRTDACGLERLTLTVSGASIHAESTVICVEDGGFRLDHRWTISRDWRVNAVEIEKWGADGNARLRLERAGRAWSVDGAPRPDLDDADEPDLSVTPFCNTFPIQRLRMQKLQSLTLATCFIDAATMTVAPSRQKYDQLRPDVLRYTDLGLQAGFEAQLRVDARGLIISYEGLFERASA